MNAWPGGRLRPITRNKMKQLPLSNPAIDDSSAGKRFEVLQVFEIGVGIAGIDIDPVTIDQRFD